MARKCLHLIQGGLTQPAARPGIYRLRERRVAAPAEEAWPRQGEWRRLVHSLMRNRPK